MVRIGMIRERRTNDFVSSHSAGEECSEVSLAIDFLIPRDRNSPQLGITRYRRGVSSGVSTRKKTEATGLAL